MKTFHSAVGRVPLTCDGLDVVLSQFELPGLICRNQPGIICRNQPGIICRNQPGIIFRNQPGIICRNPTQLRATVFCDLKSIWISVCNKFHYNSGMSRQNILTTWQISSLGHWIEQVVITWLQYIIEHYRINICMNFNVSYFYFHSGLHVITVFEPQYQCLSSHHINVFELSINVWIQDWPPLRNLWNKSFWMSRWVWAFNSHNLSVSTPFLMAPLYGRGS